VILRFLSVQGEDSLISRVAPHIQNRWFLGKLRRDVHPSGVPYKAYICVSLFFSGFIPARRQHGKRVILFKASRVDPSYDAVSL
jgi:hypothetical protein